MRLTEEAIQAALSDLSAWSRAGDSLVLERVFPSFLDGVAFVQQVALLAEAADHHPDMLIRWRNVQLTLTTHDAGGLTAKDFALAAQLEALLKP